MECLICPLKESMICSIFPCAISVLFTDWDKNQEGFICQKQNFKAEWRIQSPESQLEPTHAISPQDRASQRPAVTGLRDTQRADRDDGPQQPLNRSTVYTKIKVFVQGSHLLEDLPCKATEDVQQLQCEPSLPSLLRDVGVIGKQWLFSRCSMTVTKRFKSKSIPTEGREGEMGWFGRIVLTHIHYHAKPTAQPLSPVPPLAPWTVAHQAPPSMGFSRQEHWSGLPLPTPAGLPDPGIKPMSLMSLALTDRFFTTHTTSEAPCIVSWKLLYSTRELSWVLCDDLEGWKGGPWGRGYMDTYSWFTLL